MKTITIRLPDLEAVMLEDMRRRSKRYRTIDELVSSLARQEYIRNGKS